MAFRAIRLDVRLFRNNEPDEVERSKLQLLALLHGLVAVNRLWLKFAPKTPVLYESAVRYEPENGTENWQDIPSTLTRGYGDCEDLAGWRTAELNYLGVAAKPFIRWIPPSEGRGWLFHIVVWRPATATGGRPEKFLPPEMITPKGPTMYPDQRPGQMGKGWIEDPSLVLGMGWEKEYSARKLKADKVLARPA